ncbi:MAG: hypothetical protein PCFJNLEI_04223 [Verrucomicrobiae bacterium]|nr:hypothetical protein [Verrucomicrobiae bacterium]
MFHVVPASTRTLLFEEPVPIVNAPVSKVALVTSMELLPDPMLPMVIAPLDTTPPPSTRKKLPVEPLLPTVMIPPRTVPPLLMIKLLPNESALVPMLMPLANKLPLLAMVTALLMAALVPMANTPAFVHEEALPLIRTFWLLQPRPTM